MQSIFNMKFHSYVFTYSMNLIITRTHKSYFYNDKFLGKRFLKLRCECCQNMRQIEIKYYLELNNRILHIWKQWEFLYLWKSMMNWKKLKMSIYIFTENYQIDIKCLSIVNIYYIGLLPLFSCKPFEVEQPIVNLRNAKWLEL